MKVLKPILITLLILVLLALFFRFLFPKLFWALHDVGTRALQTKANGQNALELRYSDDEHEAVTVWHEDFVTDEGTLEYVYFYPASLAESDELYPVVVWGNGTNNTYKNYEAALRSLASYGFVVVGCTDSNMGDGRALYEMAQHAKLQNYNAMSPLCGKLDRECFGVAGHSQGACGAVNAATKYEESKMLFKSLFTTSLPKLEMCVDKGNMPFAYWAYDVSEISVPYFATTGTRFLDSMWISPLAAMQENFSHLGDIEAYTVREKGANHNIVNEFHACGYFNAWFCYTLKGDMEAAQCFTPPAEIAANTARWCDWMSK